MSEAPGPVIEAPPQIPHPREVQYPGLKVRLGEITNEDPDIKRLVQIENELPSTYSGKMKKPEVKEMREWFDNQRSNFGEPPFGKKGNSDRKLLIATTEAEEEADELMVAARNPDGTFDAYTYLYETRNKRLVPEELREAMSSAKLSREFSYVSHQAEESRDPRTMAEAYIGTHILLAEQILNRNPSSFTGAFSPEEIAEVDSKLILYSVASMLDEEGPNREALAMAGYKDYGEFIDPKYQAKEEQKAVEEGREVQRSEFVYYAFGGKFADVLAAKAALAQTPVAPPASPQS